MDKPMVNECNSFEIQRLFSHRCVAISEELLFSTFYLVLKLSGLAFEYNRDMFVEFLFFLKGNASISQFIRVNSEHTLNWFDSTPHVTHFTHQHTARENYLFISLTHARVGFFLFVGLLLFWNFFFKKFLLRRRDSQSTLCCHTKCHRTDRMELEEENLWFEFSSFLSIVFSLSRSRKFNQIFDF